MTPQTKGRLLLVAIVFFFALPAIVAKTVLTNHWYQSGVTNKGTLVEPRVTLDSLGISANSDNRIWQVGYLVPEQCDQVCRQHIHLLIQSHTALGKEQGRVEPVLLLGETSDMALVSEFEVKTIQVNEAFIKVINSAEIVIVDPLGQLVMHYPKADVSQLVMQSKSLLADLRKLLKLSRVG